MLPRREPVPLPPPLAAPDLPTAALAFAPAPSPSVEAPRPAPIAPRPDPQPAAEAPAPPVVVAARPTPAEETAEPAGARVDLNSASVAQLNALEGGGPIGRAIVRGRPYKEPEDLVRKRVVSRATFERIKDQVEAR
jgi:DNA uptake protein ComE-like DNA-binding protein